MVNTIIDSKKPTKFGAVKSNTLIFEKKFEHEFYTNFYSKIRMASIEMGNIFLTIDQLGHDIKNQINQNGYYILSIEKDKEKAFGDAWKELFKQNSLSDKIKREITDLERAIKKVGRKTFIKLLQDVKKKEFKPKAALKKMLFYKEKNLKETIEHNDKLEITFIESLKTKIQKIQKNIKSYCKYVTAVFDRLVEGFPSQRVERNLVKSKKNNYLISLKNINNSLDEATTLLTSDIEIIKGYERVSVHNLEGVEE